MDRNYKLTAKEIWHTVDRVSGDNLVHFPIERARARDSWYLLGLLTRSWSGYGWALERHIYVSILLVIQFIHGFLSTYLYNIFNTLLPESPSTAASFGGHGPAASS